MQPKMKINISKNSAWTEKKRMTNLMKLNAGSDTESKNLREIENNSQTK